METLLGLWLSLLSLRIRSTSHHKVREIYFLDKEITSFFFKNSYSDIEVCFILVYSKAVVKLLQHCVFMPAASLCQVIGT